MPSHDHNHVLTVETDFFPYRCVPMSPAKLNWTFLPPFLPTAIRMHLSVHSDNSTTILLNPTVINRDRRARGLIGPTVPAIQHHLSAGDRRLFGGK